MRQKQICSWVCLKAKKEARIKIVFPLTSSKPNLPILGAKKTLNKIKFQIFFLAIVLCSKRKVFLNFQKQIFIFVIFESENFAAHAPYTCVAKIADYWNLTHKNVPDRQNSAHFWKSQKVTYHSTLLNSRLGQFVSKIWNWKIYSLW